MVVRKLFVRLGYELGLDPSKSSSTLHLGITTSAPQIIFADMTSTPETPKSSARAPSRHGDVEALFPTPPTDVFPSPSIRVRGRSSPAPKKLLELKRAVSTPPEFTHENRSLSSSRPTEDLPSASSLAQSWNRQQLSKKRSQYYDGAFAYREVAHTAKDRVARDALVLAEVKLNCFVSQYFQS